MVSIQLGLVHSRHKPDIVKTVGSYLEDMDIFLLINEPIRKSFSLLELHRFLVIPSVMAQEPESAGEVNLLNACSASVIPIQVTLTSSQHHQPPLPAPARRDRL